MASRDVIGGTQLAPQRDDLRRTADELRVDCGADARNGRNSSASGSSDNGAPTWRRFSG